MSSSIVASLMTGLSKEEIETIVQLLKLRQQPVTTSSSSDSETTLSLVDDYTSDDEEEVSSQPSPTKRGIGREKTSLKKEPIIKRPAGRPKKVPTAEDLDKEKAEAILKAQKKADREANKVVKADIARQTQLRVAARKEATQAKKAEKDQKSLELLKKRTEIYGTMLADAEAYKAKWDL
jgi:preprotein translocase subunit SecD